MELPKMRPVWATADKDGNYINTYQSKVTAASFINKDNDVAKVIPGYGVLCNDSSIKSSKERFYYTIETAIDAYSKMERDYWIHRALKTATSVPFNHHIKTTKDIKKWVLMMSKSSDEAIRKMWLKRLNETFQTVDPKSYEHMTTEEIIQLMCKLEKSFNDAFNSDDDDPDEDL